MKKVERCCSFCPSLCLHPLCLEIEHLHWHCQQSYYSTHWSIYVHFLLNAWGTDALYVDFFLGYFLRTILPVVCTFVSRDWERKLSHNSGNRYKERNRNYWFLFSERKNSGHFSLLRKIDFWFILTKKNSTCPISNDETNKEKNQSNAPHLHIIRLPTWDAQFFKFAFIRLCTKS